MCPFALGCLWPPSSRYPLGCVLTKMGLQRQLPRLITMEAHPRVYPPDLSVLSLQAQGPGLHSHGSPSICRTANVFTRFEIFKVEKGLHPSFGMHPKEANSYL